MTCFWDAIMSTLSVEDYGKIGMIGHGSHDQFICALKKYSTATDCVKWQGKLLSTKQKDENLQHIRDFDISTIRRGYDCSTCDPFLLLISELFGVNIRHKYNNIDITYTMPSQRMIKFTSNPGHFSVG
jgi:hypothetical protein